MGVIVAPSLGTFRVSESHPLCISRDSGSIVLYVSTGFRFPLLCLYSGFKAFVVGGFSGEVKRLSETEASCAVVTQCMLQKNLRAANPRRKLQYLANLVLNFNPKVSDRTLGLGEGVGVGWRGGMGFCIWGGRCGH